MVAYFSIRIIGKRILVWIFVLARVCTYVCMYYVLYTGKHPWGKLSHLGLKMAICGKTIPVVFYRLILLIDKAMIRRKRFLTEWKTEKLKNFSLPPLILCCIWYIFSFIVFKLTSKFTEEITSTLLCIVHKWTASCTMYEYVRTYTHVCILMCFTFNQQRKCHKQINMWPWAGNH